MKKNRHILFYVLLVAQAGGMVSCIDEDRSYCPPPSAELEITYVITQGDELDPVFSQDLSSLHLGFWNGMNAKYSETILEDSQVPDDRTFIVTLPRDKYDHIVTANCQKETGTGSYHATYAALMDDVVIEQPALNDTSIRAMSRPTYAGYLQLPIEERDCNTHFTVELYPVMSKMELVVRHSDHLSNIRCHVRGTLAGYRCGMRDYVSEENFVTVADEFLRTIETGKETFQFYTFPTAAGVSPIKTAQPAPSDSGEGLWQIIFLADGEKDGKKGTHTYTCKIKEHVYAGEVYRLEIDLDRTDVEAGVEVDTDWKPGNIHDEEI